MPRPIGFLPVKYRLAIVSFTIVTRGARAVSRSLNSLPATSGMPVVAK
jgi:hypothetical protein